MKIIRSGLWAGLIASALVGTGPAARAQEPPPAKVRVATVEKKSVAENNAFQGLLYYDRVGQVSADVAGLVVGVEVEDGDRVEGGAPLVRLDTERLDQEMAALGTRLERIDVRIEHTHKQFQRLQTLYAQDGVSEKALDDARFSYEDARMEKRVLERSLEALQIQRRKSVVYAPFAGVILDQSVEVGDWVAQGKQVVRIGSIGELFVRVPIGERLLRHLPVGGRLPVTITAYDKQVTGTVVAIDPVADAKTKNVFVKVRIPTLSGIAENLSATVHVPTSAERSLALIPRDALVKFQGKDFVYTVKEGRAAILPVNIVTYLGSRVGADNPYLVAGMPVVVEGNERLRPDQAVVVVGE